VPSYRARVCFYPAENGQPGWLVEFPLWWRREEFFAHYRQRQVDTGNPWYVDYGLLLTPGEVAAWDRAERTLLADPSTQHPLVVQAMAEWDRLLAGARWVIFELYEWESGLD
jgi:hypothetical protein